MVLEGFAREGPGATRPPHCARSRPDPAACRLHFSRREGRGTRGPIEGTMVSLPPGIVLVVDDDAAVRVALQRLLVRAGMNVVTATRTREALVAARRHRGALSAIIVDLGLGQEDGARLVRHLRRRRPSLGIIVFSGNAEGVLRQDLLSLGVRDYVVKPAPLPRIVEAVRRAIAPEETHVATSGQSE